MVIRALQRRPLLPLVLGVVLTVSGCKSEEPAPTATPAPKTQAPPTPKPPPVVDADVVPGKKLGPLTVGAKPPAGHDGTRARSDGLTRLYWSELGVFATVGKDGLVAGAGAASPAADPFFRKPFEGTTSQGIGIGAAAAEAKSKLGPCEEKPSPSPFVSDRVVLTCKVGGLSLDLAKPGGEVIAMWVGARGLPQVQ